MPLANELCQPCSADLTKLDENKMAAYVAEVPEWAIVAGHHLQRTYRFPDFRSALQFVNQVGDVAERQGHHPNIDFTWGRVTITIFTHNIDGLSKNDFVLAARISQLDSPLSKETNATCSE